MILYQMLIGLQADHDNYLGCFSGNFDLTLENRLYQSNLSHSSCSSVCSDLKYPYLGLSDGTFCYCGSHDPNETLQRDSDTTCDLFCAGTPKCGGENATAVYDVKSGNDDGNELRACLFNVQFDFGGKFDVLSVSMCKDKCSAYKYIGLSNGDSCRCNNSLDTKKKVANQRCLEQGIPCAGGEKCGGRDKLAVWKQDVAFAPEKNLSPIGLVSWTTFIIGFMLGVGLILYANRTRTSLVRRFMGCIQHIRSYVITYISRFRSETECKDSNSHSDKEDNNTNSCDVRHSYHCGSFKEYNPSLELGEGSTYIAIQDIDLEDLSVSSSREKCRETTAEISTESVKLEEVSSSFSSSFIEEETSQSPDQEDVESYDEDEDKESDRGQLIEPYAVFDIGDCKQAARGVTKETYCSSNKSPSALTYDNGDKPEFDSKKKNVFISRPSNDLDKQGQSYSVEEFPNDVEKGKDDGRSTSFVNAMRRFEQLCPSGVRGPPLNKTDRCTKRKGSCQHDIVYSDVECSTDI